MADQPLDQIAFPQALRTGEERLFKSRPKWAAPAGGQKPQLVGVALSGGGIRSATFCLGVFQALAKLKLLKEIDYLSSVSGGGYFAAFLGRIFTRDDVASVEQVENILSPDRAGQAIDPGTANWKEGVFRWLRENGRYLSPKGAGDLLLDLAVVFRNWVSLQIVLALFVFALFFAAQLVRHAIEGSWSALTEFDRLFAFDGYLWWSPYTLLSGLILVLVAFPLGWAYWLVTESDPGDESNRLGEDKGWCRRFQPPQIWTVLAVAIGALAAIVIGLVRGPRALTIVAVLTLAASLMTGGFWYFAILTAIVAEKDPHERLYRGAELRKRLSVWLKSAFAALLAILGFALIDSAGQTIYVLDRACNFHPYKWIVALLGPIGVIAPFAKWLFSLASGNTKSKHLSPSLKLIAGVGAAVVIIPVIVGIDSLSHAVAFGGAIPANAPTAIIAPPPSPCTATVTAGGISYRCTSSSAPSASQDGDRCQPAGLARKGDPLLFVRLVAALAGALILSLLLGRNWPFLNRSALSTIYTDRLTRAYLGASNHSRYESSEGGVSDVMRGDDLPQEEYWDTGRKGRYSKGMPIHLVNVTINENIDPHSQLQQQDRRGIGMALGPAGVSAGVRHHVVFRPSESERDQYRDATIYPSDAFRVFEYPNNYYNGQPLSLGKWVGISGAALATGLGSRTSLGLSILTGFFNLRLGQWWDSGTDQHRDHPSDGKRPRMTLARRLEGFFKCVLPVQAFVLDEILARFRGTEQRWWYLSDGGHFENLGAYELIRRRLPLIVVIDAGADPDYDFEDLANLVRKARLDFSAEIRFLDQQELDSKVNAAVRKFFGTLDQLRRGLWAEEPVTDPNAPRKRLSVASEEERLSLAHAALAEVRYDGSPDPASMLMLIKPTLTGDEPADVLRYHAEHPSFPHQTTAEQFFDEAQWESYRRLGQHIATQLFQPVTPGGGFNPGAMRC